MRLHSFYKASLGALGALSLMSSASAAVFGGAFADNFRQQNVQTVESPLGFTRSFSSTGQGGRTVTADVVSNLRKVGVRIEGQRMGGVVRASLFEEVNFTAFNQSPTQAPANLRFVLAGTWTGDIALETAFGVAQPGDFTEATTAMLRTFGTRAGLVDISVGRREQIVNVAGSFSRVYDFSNPAVTPFDPGDVIICGPDSPRTNARCARAIAAARARCPRGPCEIVDNFAATRFGMGLAFDATVGAEVMLRGEVSSLNSFDLEGLIAFDALSGDRVDGVFFNDQGIDLTFGDNYGNQIDLTLSPVPVPAAAPLFMAVSAAFAGMKFRKRKER